MGLLEKAKKDWAKFSSNKGDFAVDVTLQAPTGEIAIVPGIHSKHHLGFDTDGNIMNVKKAHISISEDNLIKSNPAYPIRNKEGEVSLTGHLVNVKDSTGFEKKYIMQSVMPDETLGILICIVGDYEDE